MVANGVRMSCLRSLLLAFLALGCLGAQTPRPDSVGLRSDAPTYAKHGPYWVGTREFVIRTSAGNRTLPATLWYPALNPKGAKEANTFTFDDTAVSGKVLTLEGHALADAPPDPTGGSYPLLVFSPGDNCSRLFSIFFQEHAASYGFMVLGVDHPRPQYALANDLRSAIDFADQLSTSTGPFSGLIDGRNVAVSGHSTGGYTAMQVEGLRVRDGTESFLDPRVKAVILMAPDGTTSEFDFTEAKQPALLIVGSHDSPSKVPSVAGLYGALPAATKSLVIVIGGTHGGPFWDPNIPGAKYGTVDMNRVHDLVNHLTTAFLLDVMKGDREAHKALLPEAVKFEEIQYTTTWK